MKEIKELDKVLNYFLEEEDNFFNALGMVAKFQDNEKFYYQEILNKLFKDNYISEVNRFSNYSINFEGRMFAKKGGYTRQKNKENLKHTLSYLLNIVTIINILVLLFFGYTSYKTNNIENNENKDLKLRIEKIESVVLKNDKK